MAPTPRTPNRRPAGRTSAGRAAPEGARSSNGGRRRRPHPAQRARVITGALSSVGLVALTGWMATGHAATATQVAATVASASTTQSSSANASSSASSQTSFATAATAATAATPAATASTSSHGS